MAEESDESARQINSSNLTRNLSSTDNGTPYSNTARTSHIGSTSFTKLYSYDDSVFQRKNRSNSRLNVTNEVEYETQNLALKQAPSNESIVSKGSRHFSHTSPLGSFRSIRNSTRRDSARVTGINMIMVIGFAFVIALAYIFNKIEICLKWLQVKLNEVELRLFRGKSVKRFYAHESSFGKKCLYSPLGGLMCLIQMLVYVSLKSFEILKKPAPKALVDGVFSRYLKD